MDWKEEDHPRDKGGLFCKKEREELTEAKRPIDTTIPALKVSKTEYRMIFAETMSRISTVRNVLEKKGKVLLSIRTGTGLYAVELYDDDEYSFKIIARLD